MSKQTGFTLIEILVTVIVLSIGLLGLAGLQAVALKFNSASYQRSQATVLIYDIIERIRANQNPNSFLKNNISCINSGACADPNLQQWLNTVVATLPGPPVISILLPAGRVRVAITWDDSRGQNEINKSPNPTVSMETSL